MPEKTKAHYIWIGKPQTENISNLKGDLKGPVAMAQQVDPNKTTLYFWCLKEHFDVFSQLLSGKNIIVRSIDDYLEEKKENPYAQAVSELRSYLFSDMRGDIRDRVTFKEAISYLLLYLEGGYVLDTNVLPFDKDEISFPQCDAFHVTAIHRPVEKNRDMDIWMMYSPPKNPAHAETALRHFLFKIKEVEDKRKEESLNHTFNYESYKTAVLDIVIESARSHAGLQYWIPRHLGGNYPIQLRVENPRIIKHYANSHYAADRKAIPLFHLAVSKNDIVAVKDLFNKYTFDINAVDETEKYTGITALNIATFYGYTEMAALLIAKGADVNIQLQPIHAEKKACLSTSPGPFNASFFPLSDNNPPSSFLLPESASQKYTPH